MCCLYLILYLTFDLVFIMLFCSSLLPGVDYALAFFSGIVLFNNYVPSTERCIRTYSNKNQGNIVNNKNLHLPNGISRYDLMWLSGFIEGDGCFSVSRHSGVGGYITYVLSIGLHSDDLPLLYEISSLLNGQGRIYETRRYNTKNRNVVIFRLQKKEVLKSVVLPIFDTYSFLTPKYYGYAYFKNCLLSNILRYDDLPRFSITTKTPYNTVNEILNVPYYDAWLVGFINAEGSFFINKKRGVPVDACFKITQTRAPQIIESIKVRLNLSASVSLYRVHDSYEIRASSVQDINNIIRFLYNAPVKLKGVKYIQFCNWLNSISNLPRYRNFIFIPNNY